MQLTEDEVLLLGVLSLGVYAETYEEVSELMKLNDKANLQDSKGLLIQGANPWFVKIIYSLGE